MTQAASVISLPNVEERDVATTRSGPAKNDVRRQWEIIGSKKILDMGEGSREQGFRLNGCR